MPDRTWTPAASDPAVPPTGSGEAHPAHPWHRFVAIGDSFTEGVGDPDPEVEGAFRGWADRTAIELGRTVPDFEYANLAVRGRLYRQILDEQLEPALALDPDLVSICAGGNDVLRRADPDVIAAEIDSAVDKLAATGADLILWAAPDIGSTPVLNLIRGRAAIYNENMRAIAQRHHAVVVDMWALRELTHESMWAPDRLHFSPLGHRTIAARVLDTLGVEHELAPPGLTTPEQRSWSARRQEDLHWAREYFGPWVLRRLRRQSSGDHVAPKRPSAAPVFGHPMPPGSAVSPSEEHEADPGSGPAGVEDPPGAPES